MRCIRNIYVIQSFQGRYGEIYAYDYYGGPPELFPRGEIFTTIILITELSILVNYSHEIRPIHPVFQSCLADGEQKREKRRVQ